jgi:L-methionine (R)-S-oxide reductase
MCIVVDMPVNLDSAAVTAELLGLIRAGVDAAATPWDAVEVTMRLLDEARPSWGWVGVYLLDGDELVLSPYVGPATEHTVIPVGQGVCGTAVAEDRNQRVDDVRDRDNYLACSTGTRSELVVLIRHGGRVVGQIDVDSDEVAAFGPGDEDLLAGVAAIIAEPAARLALSAPDLRSRW